MANSYTAIPNIVPGNLIVNGKLTVNGGQIAMGKYQRQYRIQELANGQFVETVNVDRIAGAQDDGATASLMRVIYATGPPFAVATEPAGSPMTDTYVLNQQPTAFQVLSPELRVGTVIPFARLYNIAGTGGFWSANLQTDGSTRDDATKPGLVMGYNVTGQNLTATVVDTAGNHYGSDARRVFWSDHAPYNKTGSTALQQIATKVIYGNQLGPSGGIFLRMHGVATTVAGGAVAISIVWGGTGYGALTIPGSLSNVGWVSEAVILNRNTPAAQSFQCFGAYSSQVFCGPVITPAIDSTVNQNLTVNTQNTNVSDSVTVQGIEAEFIARALGL